jgi:drug/metabolite transporter (DMT)-like permease
MHHDTVDQHPARLPGITTLLLLGYYGIQLAAGLCFRGGGMDPPHWLLYFIVGNALGITSTALLMGVYARMNVNLAMLLATSGTFLLVQLVFWQLFHTPLTWLQGAGILLVALGTALASRLGESNTEAVEKQQATCSDCEAAPPC